jgi:Holliday junction resolvase RusA-like endonuclease
VVIFEIPGKPHAKQRARGGRFGHYTPKETVAAETFIRLTAAPLFAEPIAGPVGLDILAVFEPPKSWSAAKRKRMLGSAHIQRPDFDNIEKSVCDALNGIAYADDGQIAEARTVKRWGPVAKTVVTVRALEVRE